MTTTVAAPFAPPKRGKWLQFALMMVPLLVLFGLTACVGSPRILAQPPAFELQSPMGLTGVSIRMPLPDRTDRESKALIRTGMLQALPGSTLVTPLTAPFPKRRYVWHVSPNVPTGTSRLVLNRFEGSKAVAYVQEDIGDHPSDAALLAVIESMTRRLYAQSAARSPE